jgi:acylphosphatase
MERVVVYYSGRVQGVGFRAAVRHIACGYDVTGTIRNHPDGRVEVVAEGVKTELKAFLDGVARSELSGLIARRIETWSSAQGDLRGFVITL